MLLWMLYNSCSLQVRRLKSCLEILLMRFLFLCVKCINRFTFINNRSYAGQNSTLYITDLTVPLKSIMYCNIDFYWLLVNILI